jgi:hypothetical protein
MPVTPKKRKSVFEFKQPLFSARIAAVNVQNLWVNIWGASCALGLFEFEHRLPIGRTRAAEH